jgi:hypothetical protein
MISFVPLQALDTFKGKPPSTPTKYQHNEANTLGILIINKTR